ncbi:MAG: ankyrin repeat domain-containing protein [Spirochaetales bacterium]|nr:ankyrin repeat domain-containing protein [Spirochaetales bacterium]
MKKNKILRYAGNPRKLGKIQAFFEKNNNFEDDQEFLLFLLNLAIECNCFENFSYIVKFLKDLDSFDSDGYSPLVVAAAGYVDPEIVETLIVLGANPNLPDRMGFVPLVHAIMNHDIAIVKRLVLFRADINYQNLDGMTPIMFAAGFNSHEEIIEYLLSHDVDLTQIDKFGLTAYDYATKNKRLRDSEIIEKLKA